MEKALTLVDTTIGKKAAVAVSGLVLFGFVLVHMLGNLQVYLGPEAFNAYAATLKGTPPVLWGARIVLLTAVVVHIGLTLSLVAKSAEARAVGYRVKKNAITTYAALTMKISGPLIFFYIVYHLAHFTAPGLAMGGYEHSHTDVYANVVNGFRIPWVVAIYVVAQGLLGMHLYHGAWSLLQSLGLSHPRYNARRKLIAQAFAVVIVVGFLAVPLGVLAGVVK